MSDHNGGRVPHFPRVRKRTCSHAVSALLAIIFIGLLSACGSNPAESQEESIVRKSYVTIQNPHNPFNRLGVIHNDGLDYIARKANSSEPSAEEVKNLLSEYLVSIGVGYINGVKDTVWYDPRFVRDSVVGAYDFWNGTVTWEGKVSFLPEQQMYIDAILREAETIEMPISASKRSTSMAAFDHIERKILSSTTLPPNRKNVPLALVAVAKHSLEYWSNCPEFYDSLIKVEGLGKTAENTKKVVAEDAKGLIIGAFAGFLGGIVRGAIGGVLTGGPAGGVGGAAAGAVVGSAVGAISGAVGASVAAVKKK